jgi:hypothetical protein
VLDKMIVVNFQSPHVPNLDLLDTPGIESNGPRRERTLQLVEEHIALNKNAIFLAVCGMTYDHSSCNSIDLIAKHNLFARTIGVVTRSDTRESAHKLQAFPAAINKLLREHPQSGGRDLGDRFVFTMCVRDCALCGCMASTDLAVINEYRAHTKLTCCVYVLCAPQNDNRSKPCPEPGRHKQGHTHAHHYERLEHLRTREEAFFTREDEDAGEPLQTLLGPSRCTVPDLITRLTSFVHHDMATSWLPNAITAIHIAIVVAFSKFEVLGLPPAHDSAYTTDPAALQALRSAAVAALDFNLDFKYAFTEQLAEECHTWYQQLFSLAGVGFNQPIENVPHTVATIIGALSVDLERLHVEVRSFTLAKLFKPLTDDNSAFKLGRFPALIDALRPVLEVKLDCALKEARGTAQTIIVSLSGPWSPFLKLTKHQDELPCCPFNVDITVDKEAVATSVLCRYTAAVSRFLDLIASPSASGTAAVMPELLAVINNTVPADWLEECAQQRAELIQRLEYLVHAREAVVRVWRPGQEQLKRVLREQLLREAEREPSVTGEEEGKGAEERVA